MRNGASRNEPKPLRYDKIEGYDIDAAFAKMRVLCAERDAIERQLFLKNREIEKEWETVPPMVTIRHNLQCTYSNGKRTCPNKTMDRFRGAAMCAKHVASGDEGIAKVLEEFLNGA